MQELDMNHQVRIAVLEKTVQLLQDQVVMNNETTSKGFDKIEQKIEQKFDSIAAQITDLLAIMNRGKGIYLGLSIFTGAIVYLLTNATNWISGHK